MRDIKFNAIILLFLTYLVLSHCNYVNVIQDSEKNLIEKIKPNKVSRRINENNTDLKYNENIKLDDNNENKENEINKESEQDLDNKITVDLRISINERIDKDILATNLTKESTDTENSTIECVGSLEFCNLTKEEYLTMMNNYIFPQTYEWVLIVTHSIVFITGLVGNALVCIAVYRNHSMRTVTNYFLVNLAVADFMVLLFCLPPTVLWDVTETWFLGDGLCKVILYFQSVSVTVSVLTLTFISLDRWYAICFPLKFKSTTSRAKIAMLMIWMLSMTFNIPELVVLTTIKPVPLRFNLEYLVQCVPTWSEKDDIIWHAVKVIFIYTIPLLLMTVAYYQIVRILWSSGNIPGHAGTHKWTNAEQTQIRSRKKAAKMLVAVVVMFAICYFPVHLLSILRYTLEQNDVATFLALVSHILCYANSAINPIIYNFMSDKFRSEFKRAFCCKTKSPEHHSTLSRVASKNKETRSYNMITYDSRCSANYPTVRTTSFNRNHK